MSGRSFRSVFMVASCAGAALGCYLVSLRVASERAALEEVETRIVLAQRDIRLLQTEIGTRGRLAQLERWNVKVLALSAPSADQFVNGGFELARMVAPQKPPAMEAPVVLASAPAGAPRPQVNGAAQDADRAVPTRDLLRTASLKTSNGNETREVPARAVGPTVQPARQTSGDGPVTAAKPARKTASTDGPGLAAAQRKPSPEKAAKGAEKKAVDKAARVAAKPMTKPARLAKSDPLAPLPAKMKPTIAKDSGPAR